MPLISYAAPVIVTDGYTLETPLGLTLADTAGAPVDVCRFSLAPGASTLEDQHAEHEIWLILCGSGRLELDGRQIPVAGGATVYFEPRARHRLHNDMTGKMQVLSVYWGVSEQEEDQS